MPFPSNQSDLAWRATDAGRALSRRPKQKNDCTVRAVSLTCRMPYDEVYDLLAAGGRVCSQGFHLIDWATGGEPEIHLKHKLTWRAFQAVKGQKRMNVKQFCAKFSTGFWIARVAGHVFAVIGGVIYDTTIPTPLKCVYGAWKVTQCR